MRLIGIMLMKTWHDLEKAFKEMVPSMQGARADGQWGYSGEYWRVAASISKNVRKRFEALASIAGEKLLEQLNLSKEPDKELIAEKDPIARWYKGIWKISNNFESDFPGRDMDDNGNVVGYSYSGRIYDVAEASATFCLELAARSGSSSYLWPRLKTRIVACLLVLMLGIGLLFTPYVQSWEWLQDHPNKIGLYALEIYIIAAVAAMIMLPKRYWKLIVTTILVGSVLVFAQIAGSAHPPSK